VVFDGLTRNERCVQVIASARHCLTWGGLVGVFCVLEVISPANAQTTGSGKIYTCVDASGRRLSSDRPIPECLDREQRELSSTGVTRRVIPPAQSDADRAREMALKQEQVQQREQEKAKQKEADRRNQLMLMRYPNQTKHDAERQSQLQTVQSAVTTIQIRQRELDRQRKELQTELEFYKGDVSKAPPVLQRRVKTNDEEIAVQQKLLQHQEAERQRVNTRFDEELLELKKLWSTPSARTASNAGAEDPSPAATLRPR
jgi:hypothetical protein